MEILIPQRILKSVVSLAMVAALLVSGVGSYSAETNFWKERHRDSKTLHASGLRKSTGLPVNKTSLLSALLRADSLGDFVTERLPPKFLRDPVSSLESPALSESWITKQILPYGNILDAHFSKIPDAPLIIHIQDAHGIEEAQHNIATIIQSLKDSGHLNLVGLEGANGAFSIEPYRNFPDKNMTKDIAENLLKEGLIGGPEFAGFISSNPPLLWGVENLDAYERNIKAQGEYRRFKPTLLKKIVQLQGKTEQLKGKIYSNELKEFDRNFASFKNQNQSLVAYARYLILLSNGNGIVPTFPNQHGKRINSWPNLHLLLEVSDLEKSLDFKKLEGERLHLVETLARRLSQNQLTLLVQESLECRLNRIRYRDYLCQLRKLCDENHISLNQFGKLNTYIDYVLLADKISRKDLLNELTDLEIDIENNLALHLDQKQLVECNRNILILEKMANQTLIMPEWLSYLRNREKILHVEQELKGLGSPFPEFGPWTTTNSLESLVGPLEDFYRCASQRNRYLIENLLEKMKEEKATAAVLVAGGFHTEGLSQILQKKEVSYLVVTPKITSVPKETSYLDVFARDPIPLEKLFLEEKIYLVYALRFATRQPDSRFIQDSKPLRLRVLAHQAILQAPEEAQAQITHRNQVDSNALEAGLTVKVENMEILPGLKKMWLKFGQGKVFEMRATLSNGRWAVTGRTGSPWYERGRLMRTCKSLMEWFLKDKTIREDFIIVMAGYTSLALSVPWVLPLLLAFFIGGHFENIELDYRSAVLSGQLKKGNVMKERIWKIQYWTSLMIAALILTLLLLFPGIIMTMDPSFFASWWATLAWAGPVFGPVAHRGYSRWALSRLRAPSLKWVFAPLSISRHLSNPAPADSLAMDSSNRNDKSLKEEFRNASELLVSLYNADDVHRLHQLIPQLDIMPPDGFLESHVNGSHGFRETILQLENALLRLGERKYKSIVGQWQTLGDITMIRPLHRRWAISKPSGYQLPHPMRFGESLTSETDNWMTLAFRGSSPGKSNKDLIQQELRRKFQLYQDHLINSNFAALELINLHMDSMTRSVAEAITGNVKQMVEVFVELSPEKHRWALDVLRNLQQPLEAELSRLSDTDTISSEMRKVITTGINESLWSDPQSIKTWRALINCIHQRGDQAIGDIIRNAEANTVVEVNHAKVVNIANMSNAPLVYKGRVQSRPLRAILKALENVTRTETQKETYVLRGNYLFWSSKLGDHRAEVSVNFEEPDNGGYFHVRYFEIGNEMFSELRRIYFATILQELGVHVTLQTNQYDQYMIEANLDKDHAATTVDQIATAFILTMRAFHDSGNLDYSLEAMGISRPSPYPEETTLHIAKIFLAEGYLPFYVRGRGRWDQVFFRAYQAYMKMENERIVLRDRLNGLLKGWNLPLIPTDMVFGQRVLEKYYSEVVEGALARGQLIRGNEGLPEKNPFYDPIPELLHSVLSDEGEAMQSALTLNCLSQDIIPYGPIGTVGRLLAVTGQIELGIGEWIVVRGLEDPTNGRLLYAAFYQGDGRGHLLPMGPGPFVELIKKKGHSIEVNNKPSEPQKREAQRLLRAPPLGSEGALFLQGMAASQGNGRTRTGRVTFNRHYANESSVEDAVLVVPFTTPDDIEAIKLARAVITTGGGMLSHAGITTREFGIPAVILQGAVWTEVKGIKTLKVSFVNVGKTEKDDNELWIGQDFEIREAEIHEGDVIQVNGRDGQVTVFSRESQSISNSVLNKLNRVMAGESELETLNRWVITAMNLGTIPEPVLADMVEFLCLAVFGTAVSRKDGLSRSVLDMVASLQREVIPMAPFNRLKAVINRTFEIKKEGFLISIDRIFHQLDESHQPDRSERIINQLLMRIQNISLLAIRLLIKGIDFLDVEEALLRLRRQAQQQTVQIGIELHRKAKLLMENPLSEKDLPQIRQLLNMAKRYKLPSGKPKKVVFVCTGNTDRSPMAERLLKQVLTQEGQEDMIILSRGLQVKPAQPMSRNANLVLEEVGIKREAPHYSAGLIPEDLEGADLVLAMTQDHVDSLLYLNPKLKGKVVRLKDYGEINGGGDVEDPFGKNMATYVRTRDELSAALKGVLNRLTGAEALGKLAAKERELTAMKKKKIDQNHRAVYSLGETDVDFVSVIGGKTAKLGDILQIINRLDSSVPGGLGIATRAFTRFLDENTGMKAEFERLTHELDAHLKSGIIGNGSRQALILDYSDKIRNLIKSGSFDLGKNGVGAEILYALDSQGMDEDFLAVRSSSVHEDGDDSAFAGVAETSLYVLREDLLKKIKENWMSFFLPRGIQYCFAHGISVAEVQPATLVQKMVETHVAGVVFSVNPITGEDEVIINSSYGLGESVVSGLVQGDMYTARKSDGAEIDFPFIGSKRTKIVRNKNGDGTEQLVVQERDRMRRSLSPDEVAKLAKIARKLEEYFGYPVDIEFAISSGKTEILQVRPVTATRKSKRGALIREMDSSVPGALGIWNTFGRAKLPLIGILETILTVGISLVFLGVGMPDGPPVFDMSFILGLVQSSVSIVFIGFPVQTLLHRVFGLLLYDPALQDFQSISSQPLKRLSVFFLIGGIILMPMSWLLSAGVLYPGVLLGFIISRGESFSIAWMTLKAGATASSSFLSIPFLITGLAVWPVSWPFAMAVMSLGALVGAVVHARMNLVAERSQMGNLSFQNMPIQVISRALPHHWENKREYFKNLLQKYLLGQTVAPVGFDVVMKGNSRPELLVDLRKINRSMGDPHSLLGEEDFIREVLNDLDHEEEPWDRPAISLGNIPFEGLEKEGLSDGERSVKKIAGIVERQARQFAALDGPARSVKKEAFLLKVQPLISLLHHFDRSFLKELGLIRLSKVAEAQAMDLAFIFNLAFGEEALTFSQDHAKSYTQMRERANQWGLNTRAQSLSQALKENRSVVVNVSEIFEKGKGNMSAEDRAILMAKLRGALADLKVAIEQNTDSQSLIGLTVRDPDVTEESIRELDDEKLKSLMGILLKPGYNARLLLASDQATILDSKTGKLSARRVASRLGNNVVPIIYTINAEDWVDLKYALARIILSGGLVRNAASRVMEEIGKFEYIKVQS